MKNLFRNSGKPVVLFLMYAVVITSAAFTLACPKKSAVRSAIDASYRLPKATNDLIAKITIARDRQIITVEQARTFGALLNNVAVAEVTFVGMVKAMQAAIDAGTPATAEQLGTLRSFFDVSIVEPFLRVLELAKVLTGTDSQLILIAITAARLLIRKIAAGLGSANSNKLAKIGHDRIEIGTLQFA